MSRVTGQALPLFSSLEASFPGRGLVKGYLDCLLIDIPDCSGLHIAKQLCGADNKDQASAGGERLIYVSFVSPFSRELPADIRRSPQTAASGFINFLQRGPCST